MEHTNTLFKTAINQYQSYPSDPVFQWSIWCNRSIRDLYSLIASNGRSSSVAEKVDILSQASLAAFVWFPVQSLTLTDMSLRVCSKHFLGWPQAESPLSEIIPGLFLGNKLATGETFLKENDIQCVISILDEEISIGENIDHLHIQKLDYPHVDLSDHFQEVFEKITKSLAENKNILVHCNLGMCRSATLVIAFLMQSFKMPFDEVYSWVRERKSNIDLNPGFVQQLQNLENDIFHNSNLQ